MSVLLSIKPRYVKEIKNNNKLYEFRKQIFKQDVDEIWVYESAPTQRIVGKIVVSKVIKDTPTKLWSLTKENAGIDQKSFFDYFSGKCEGYAIKIKKFYELETPINPYSINKNFVPPQSFLYLENNKELQKKLSFV